MQWEEAEACSTYYIKSVPPLISGIFNLFHSNQPPVPLPSLTATPPCPSASRLPLLFSVALYLHSYLSISLLISPLFPLILSIAVLIHLYPIYIHLPPHAFSSHPCLPLRSPRASIVSSNWFSFLPASRFFIKSSVIISGFVCHLSFPQLTSPSSSSASPGLFLVSLSVVIRMS